MFVILFVGDVLYVRYVCLCLMCSMSCVLYMCYANVYYCMYSYVLWVCVYGVYMCCVFEMCYVL